MSNNLLKLLIKPQYYGNCYCHSKNIDEQGVISFIYCPYCTDNICTYFNETLQKTKYESYFRVKTCRKTFEWNKY